MSQTDQLVSPEAVAEPRSGVGRILHALVHDRAAVVAAIFLLIVILSATVGAYFLESQVRGVNMTMRNAPPQLSGGWAYFLGGDNLGRSLLIRIIVGARTTMEIAASAVICSMLIGAVLGLIAGLKGKLVGELIMRLADVIMSFPSLLTALIVLYLLGPSAVNLVLVLAITRIPVYLRTVRAEVLELRSRPFVNAARSMGASQTWIVQRHLLPLIGPTLLTIASVDFAAVIIAESGLSFLGLGIQSPDITWGAMVAIGRAHLAQAWWVAFFPGLAIMLTTLSLALLSNWLRLVTDPNQRWRFVSKKK